MDEKRLLEQIRESAQDIQIPDSLKPENVEKKLEHMSKSGVRSGHSPWKMWQKGLVSAAAIVLCIGIAAAAGRYFAGAGKNAGSYEMAKMEDQASMEAALENVEETAAAAAEDIGEAGGDTGGTLFQSGTIAITSMYTQAADYGEIYDFLNTGAYSASVQEGTEGRTAVTDGNYLYVRNEQAVQIVALNQGQMELISELQDAGGEAACVKELYVEGDILQVIAEEQGAVRLLTYDISDRRNPALQDSVEQDGSYRASWKSGEYICLISEKYLEKTSDDAYEPGQEGSVPDWMPSANGKVIAADCCYFSENRGNQAVIISAVNLNRPGEAADTKLVIGEKTGIYITAENIILKENSYEYGTNAIKLAKIFLNDGTIEAESAAVVGDVQKVIAGNELYAWEDGLLLGIEYEMDLDAGEAVGTKLTLFDSSDPENINGIGQYVLDANGGSPVLTGQDVLTDEARHLVGFAGNVYGREDCEKMYFLFSCDGDGFPCVWAKNLDEVSEIGESVQGICVGNTLYLVSSCGIASYDMADSYGEISTLSLS